MVEDKYVPVMFARLGLPKTRQPEEYWWPPARQQFLFFFGLVWFVESLAYNTTRKNDYENSLIWADCIAKVEQLLVWKNKFT